MCIHEEPFLAARVTLDGTKPPGHVDIANIMPILTPSISFEASMEKIESAAATRPYHHGDLRRALVEAAFALVTEEQDWSFSLREVARRAGVSHNAPYNHFSEKRDLLGAVAALGFEKLRDRMLQAIAETGAAEAALAAAAQAYVGFAVDNPALYRLMFGPALAEAPEGRPARAAGADAKAVLEQIILRGARDGTFVVGADDHAARAMAALYCWSAVHGLTLLVIDGKAEAKLPIHDLVNGLVQIILEGLASK
jgi:AcrR family transcriptional regulator